MFGYSLFTFTHEKQKCANILVDKNLNVKLCDLGLSKYKERKGGNQATVSADFKGTKNYLSPKIILHKDTTSDTAVDIWALGCLMCEIFTESYAWNVEDFDGNIETALRDKILPDQSLVPTGLQDAVKKCFEYAPSKRATVDDILDAIESL